MYWGEACTQWLGKCGVQTLSLPPESAPAPSKGSEKAIGDTDKQQIDVTQFPTDALHTYTIPTGWNFRAHKASAPLAEGCLLHWPQPLWLPAGCPGHCSSKYMGVSGEFKQNAGVKSKLRKVFSSFCFSSSGETELFAFSRRLFMERAGWEIENRRTSSLGKNMDLDMT